VKGTAWVKELHHTRRQHRQAEQNQCHYLGRGGAGEHQAADRGTGKQKALKRLDLPRQMGLWPDEEGAGPSQHLRQRVRGLQPVFDTAPEAESLLGAHDSRASARRLARCLVKGGVSRAVRNGLLCLPSTQRVPSICSAIALFSLAWVLSG
jgi:hypothetical protein